jgi:hypothetical protein
MRFPEWSENKKKKYKQNSKQQKKTVDHTLNVYHVVHHDIQHIRETTKHKKWRTNANRLITDGLSSSVGNNINNKVKDAEPRLQLFCWAFGAVAEATKMLDRNKETLRKQSTYMLIIASRFAHQTIP